MASKSETSTIRELRGQKNIKKIHSLNSDTNKPIEMFDFQLLFCAFISR